MDKLLKKGKAKYLKGSILAITANSVLRCRPHQGGFRLCELVEDIFEDTDEAQVRFLSSAGSRYNDNTFYKPFLVKSIDLISCGLILTEVKMCPISRLLLKLSDSEIDRITLAINSSYAVLQSAVSNEIENPSKAFYNRDDYHENDCIIENAEVFDNLTLFNLNFDDDMGSVVHSLDINDIFSPKNTYQNPDTCKNDLAVNEVNPVKSVDEVNGEHETEVITFNQNIPDNLICSVVHNLDINDIFSPKNTYQNPDTCKNDLAVNEVNPVKSVDELNGEHETEVITFNQNIPDNNESPNVFSDDSFNKAVLTNNKPHNNESPNLSSDEANLKINVNFKEDVNLPNMKSGGEGIFFSFSSKNNLNNKRVYDKKHACMFCNSLVCKLTRHLISCHASESEVAKLMALPGNSKERKNGFLELMRMGDFFHNSHVLAVEEGELILVRRPSKTESSLVSYKDFGPCPGCTGFMLKKHLWHHTRECPFFSKRRAEAANNQILQQSNALMTAVLHPNMNEAFRSKVLAKINDDDVGKVAKSDETILSFGMMMVEKHDDEQYELTRQSMRQLARLLIELRRVTNYPVMSLREFIKPSYFDDIILAVKNISGINNLSGKVVPSLALKCGYHIQKCAGIIRGYALRQSNSEDDKSCRDFLDLYSLEWNTKISSSALNVMNKRNMNSANMIPLTSDLMKINAALTEDLKTMLKEGTQREMDTESWLKLAKVTLCRLIMFNKKRGGEAAKITIQQYASKPNWSAENEENFMESLSTLERHLVNKLTLIEIRGKRRKIVPVLLTEDVNKAITVLINTRESAGVSKYNPYIFARPYCQSIEALRGSDCLRDYVKTLKLQKPNLVNSTKLRKYIATTSQVFDLHENEVDWLARHLGHDINVHRNFYRIHHSAIELTKVSKLLMAVDKGKINEFAGKTLDDINVEDLFEDECISDTDMNVNQNESDVDDELDESFQHDVPALKKRIVSAPASECSTANTGCKSTLLTSNKCSKVKGKKSPWTADEKKVVLTFFRDNIKHKSLPGKAQCLKCINEHKQILGQRPWTKIKDFIRNYMKTLCRD